MWLRLAALATFIMSAAVAEAVFGASDIEELRSRVTGAGLAGLALFVIVYALATLAPLPKNVLSAAAGLLFGVVTGTALVLVAALLGAVAAFRIGRALGRDAVQRLTGRRLAHLDRVLDRRGFLAVVAVRLVPIVPFTAVNYGCGLLAVRFRDYLPGTAIGILPGTVAFVVLGDYGTTPRSWQFAVSAAVLAALTVAGWAVARRSRAPRAGHGPAGATVGGTGSRG